MEESVATYKKKVIKDVRKRERSAIYTSDFS